MARLRSDRRPTRSKATLLRNVVVVLVAGLVLGSCSGAPGSAAPQPGPSASPESGGDSPTSSSAPGAPAAPTGPTGPACHEMLGDGDAAARAMADDPVVAAASHNPHLSRFVEAVGEVPGLADTLDHARTVTVLVPANTAFEALPAARSQALSSSPREIGRVLDHHVIDGRYDSERLIEVGEATMIDGSTVLVGGSPGAPTFTDSTGETANTLCGDIPTANGVVFVVDNVLQTAR